MRSPQIHAIDMRNVAEIFDRRAQYVALAHYWLRSFVDGAEGMIVETEVYGRDDPASHCFKGPSIRNRSMPGAQVRSYIYRIYGLCWYTNFVCANASAVLFHAIAPLAGTDLMKQRRNTNRITELCSGPVNCLLRWAYLGLFPKPSRVLARFVSRNRGLHYRPVSAR